MSADYADDSKYNYLNNYLMIIDGILREKIDKLDSRLSSLEAILFRYKEKIHVTERRQDALFDEYIKTQSVINKNFEMVRDEIRELKAQGMPKHNTKPNIWTGDMADLTFYGALDAARSYGKRIKRPHWADDYHYYFYNNIFEFSEQDYQLPDKQRTSDLTINDIRANDWMILE